MTSVKYSLITVLRRSEPQNRFDSALSHHSSTISFNPLYGGRNLPVQRQSNIFRRVEIGVSTLAMTFIWPGHEFEDKQRRFVIKEMLTLTSFIDQILCNTSCTNSYINYCSTTFNRQWSHN